MKATLERAGDSYSTAAFELAVSLKKEHPSLIQTLSDKVRGKKVVIAAAGKSGRPTHGVQCPRVL